MKHSPLEVLIPILLTCDICLGETTYRNADDELCRCGCQNGHIAVALPIADVLHAHTIPSDAARHGYLLNCAKQQTKVSHPLLHSTATVPLHYTTPLIPNASDGKRRIPLVPKP